MEQIARLMSFSGLPYEEALEIAKGCKSEEEAKKVLAVKHKMLAFKIASRYKRDVNQFYWDDIDGTALLGLVRAGATFDCSKNYQFSTYAGSCIVNEINRFFRDYVSKATKVSGISMDESVYTNQTDGDNIVLSDMLFDKTDDYDAFIMKDAIESFFKEITLTDREMAYINLRYVRGLTTQKEIANELKLHPSRVSTIESKLKTFLSIYLNDGCIERTNVRAKVYDYLDNHLDDYKNMKKCEIIRLVSEEFKNTGKTEETLRNYVYEWYKTRKNK